MRRRCGRGGHRVIIPIRHAPRSGRPPRRGSCQCNAAAHSLSRGAGAGAVVGRGTVGREEHAGHTGATQHVHAVRETPQRLEHPASSPGPAKTRPPPRPRPRPAPPKIKNDSEQLFVRRGMLF
jgi:hypothetical protein